MTRIDIHTHVCPLEFPSPPNPGEGRWPCMVCGESGARMLTIDGKPFRGLDARSWDAARRMEDMDREGIAIQVLSPMPELLSYWLSPDAAEAMCDHVNHTIGTLVGAGAGRFRGLGMAPLQDPARAAAYLPRLRTVFGLEGFEIGSNIEGRLLSAPDLEPVFSVAADAGLAVFVHALHPLSPGPGHPPYLVNGAGFPLDVGMAAAALISTGVMGRHPDLRIAFSHGGGAIHAIAPRLDKVWALSDGFEGRAAELPSATIRRMYFDSNVYSPAQLAHLARTDAPGQICIGTDYPYRIQQTDVAAYVSAAGLAASELDSLSYGAARRFLGEA
jgi:aminocarboxymuconate-semialdehyde decarboxylase